ncbi:hypothetical protein D9756_008901 [Leucocoprinus leucothites]|uniref:Uncharacterized protein n=1 Tax=Leucocoprinus leucothites TaxID=201217 RepID=A0A8H5FUH2_9AGAR|nr:hypothetical protein D9756_008901 [Leucoagaricus leucothites]
MPAQLRDDLSNGMRSDAGKTTKAIDRRSSVSLLKTFDSTVKIRKSRLGDERQQRKARTVRAGPRYTVGPPTPTACSLLRGKNRAREFAAGQATIQETHRATVIKVMLRTSIRIANGFGITSQVTSLLQFDAERTLLDPAGFELSSPHQNV